jgi:hypothetical protein
MTAESVFRAKAPKLMGRLMTEFQFSVEDAAAIAGNGGHESRGFTAFQEENPTIKGSRGGWGWFQWTGPRRREFEAFADGMRLDRKSDAANIEWLVHELKTTERAAILKTKAARTLPDKVVAFEKSFERAGVKHYDSRLKWAQIARDAYQKNQGVTIPPPPDIEPIEPKPRGLLRALIDLIISIFKRKD